MSTYFWKTRSREPRPSLVDFLRTAKVDSLSNLPIYSIDGEIAADHVRRYENLDAELERIAALLKPERSLAWATPSSLASLIQPSPAPLPRTSSAGAPWRVVRARSTRSVRL